MNERFGMCVIENWESQVPIRSPGLQVSFATSRCDELCWTRLPVRETSPQPLICWRHYHAPAAALAMDYYAAAADSESIFSKTSSAFGNPLDLSDLPLLPAIFSLGPPQLRSGLGFLFCFKVSFEKHPSASPLRKSEDCSSQKSH